MNPNDLKSYLSKLIDHDVTMSAMIWGPPGIGKSSVVAEVAKAHKIALIDVRLSQLAPTDLRGLPVPENGVSRWYAPEFLPREGRGILFLDELNMAPPALQGVAQQLILDRRVGMYEVPKGWYIWAAGNRKEDKASVFDMPAPLANRFLHLDVGVDFDEWRLYAIDRGLEEKVIAFLSFRPMLLHKMEGSNPAWPSPRSWEMASRLHKLGLSVETAVGPGAAAEFEAFLAIYKNLGSIDAILSGKGGAVRFPEEPSERYAMTMALAMRPAAAQEAIDAFRWISRSANEEWAQLFCMSAFSSFRSKGIMREFAEAVKTDAALQAFMKKYQNLITNRSN